MALIKCSECGADVSEKASMCVKCGCPLDITKQRISDARKNKNNYGCAVFSCHHNRVFRCFPDGQEL